MTLNFIIFCLWKIVLDKIKKADFNFWMENLRKRIHEKQLVWDVHTWFIVLVRLGRRDLGIWFWIVRSFWWTQLLNVVYQDSLIHPPTKQSMMTLIMPQFSQKTILQIVAEKIHMSTERSKPKNIFGNEMKPIREWRLYQSSRPTLSDLIIRTTTRTSHGC